VQISDDDNDGDDGDGDLATDSFVVMSILSMYILPSANVNYDSILCHFRGKAKYWSTRKSRFLPRYVVARCR